jgi:CheY-like chemotaxis protein/chemotaxis signal transduction protein
VIEINRVPRVPDFVEGVMRIRGKVIPVIDLRTRLGLEKREYDKKSRIIVVRTGDALAGIVVDHVSKVIRVPERELEPPSPTLRQFDVLRSVGKLDSGLLFLLDADKILQDEETRTLEACTRELSGGEERAESPPSSDEIEESEVRIAGKKVLVADDSETVLDLVSHVLEEEGLDVVVAHDGQEALEKGLEERPDLILLDVDMPRMTGYTACKKLRDDPRTESTPIVIMTSRARETDRMWGLGMGADVYLTKPVAPEVLVDVVKQKLGNDDE